MMRLTKEYELELLSLPFSRGDDQVVYVESQFNPEINRFIENHLEELKKMFSHEFLDFCYVPEVCERFWERDELDWYKMPYDRRLLRLYGTHLKTHEVFFDGVRTSEIEPSLICNERGVRVGDKLVFQAYHLDLSYLDNESLMMEQFHQIAQAYSRRKAIDYGQVAPDDETASMLFEMERLARALKVKGVKAQVFDDMLASIEQPSPLVVDWRGHVLLPDFGNMQIRFNPMEKAVYIFFLKHPEGMRADDLVLYERQLMALYKSVSVFDDRKNTENAITALLAEDKKTFMSNVSRIRGKFKEKLGERVARNYIIERDRNGIYSIKLPRDLVTWQNREWLR